MLQITPSILIDERQLRFEFVRASGPGGQNVNKVATAVQLNFDVLGSSLPPDVKIRLIRLAGRRIKSQGVLQIEARRYRLQEQNREDAVARFVKLVRQAAEKPKPRRKTRPPASSREQRLKEKKRRGEIKKIRQSRSYE